MSQDGTPTPVVPEPTPSTPLPPASPDSAPATPAPGNVDDRRPPWERTGEPFDPARAWTLIERLRADVSARSAPPALSPPATPPVPVPAVGPDQAEVATLRGELVRERVARRFGLDDALRDLLGTGDEATITARAQTLADRIAKPDSLVSPIARRPVERLRGGGDPTVAPEETDPAKLAAKVRRAF